MATASPSAMGMKDCERSLASAAIMADRSPPQPRKEPIMPKQVANKPRNGADAATVAIPSSPRAIWRWTRAAARSAACTASVERQSILVWTPAWGVLFPRAAAGVTVEKRARPESSACKNRWPFGLPPDRRFPRSRNCWRTWLSRRGTENRSDTTSRTTRGFRV
jgi:hypothetical protein